jgi:dihydrofolate synthase/folylpolyglutamate synthase
MSRFLDYLSRVQRFGIRPGLERIGALLDLAGKPQTQYPLILVGGTNGKGSTAEFLTRLLAASNRSVGLYTSPHLYRWNERIRILRTNTPDELFPGAISDDELEAVFLAARPLLDGITDEHGHATEFETITLLGLWHFARQNVDAAVIEVGLGGRWDATNAADPTVSVITHVALDHCDRLGNTLQEIARDKIEIARAGRVLVTAETKPEVLQVFREHCDRIGARLWSFRAPNWTNDAEDLQNCLDALPSAELQNTAPDFQQLNLQTARVAQWAFEQSQFPEICTPTLRDKVLSTPLSFALKVPGRVEVLRKNPTVLIDGANNPDGAARLAKVLKEEWQPSGRRLIFVLGILADKDSAQMIEILCPQASHVIASQSNSPRAQNAQDVANEARKYLDAVETMVPIQSAVERALQIAEPNDVIVVTGSFYTIAEVERESLKGL